MYIYIFISIYIFIYTQNVSTPTVECSYVYQRQTQVSLLALIRAGLIRCSQAEVVDHSSVDTPSLTMDPVSVYIKYHNTSFVL